MWKVNNSDLQCKGEKNPRKYVSKCKVLSQSILKDFGELLVNAYLKIVKSIICRYDKFLLGL